MLEEKEYLKFKESTITGRYVTGIAVDQFLTGQHKNIGVKVLGKSVLENPISLISLGKGEIKILMWSQMHGNEATTTKAVLDLINYFNAETAIAQTILDRCTLYIIPVLNPDGALAYTRNNANNVDLNRDAQDLSQPESRILRDTFNALQPDFCFNLHDQRTIYNVGNTAVPATVSFLAPAHNAARSISTTRGISMQLISAMHTCLQQTIPGQVARYDDAFNANCVGDTFQMAKVPTILFEAGHFPEDYDREQTRFHIFNALLMGIRTIAMDEIGQYQQASYFDIPENKKQFFDVVIHNTQVMKPSDPEGCSVGILFKETLHKNNILFLPQIEKKGDLAGFYAHKTYNCLNNNDLNDLMDKKELVSSIS